MKPAMILASLAMLLFAWMFRYEISGHVGLSGESNGLVRPVMLDRWTGKTYIYFMNPAEMRFIGDWAEIKPGQAWTHDSAVPAPPPGFQLNKP